MVPYIIPKIDGQVFCRTSNSPVSSEFRDSYAVDPKSFTPALPLPKTEKSERVGGKSDDDTLFSGDEPIDARYDL
jgi:hypothetical protein